MFDSLDLLISNKIYQKINWKITIRDFISVSRKLKSNYHDLSKLLIVKIGQLILKSFLKNKIKELLWSLYFFRKKKKKK